MHGLNAQLREQIRERGHLSSETHQNNLTSRLGNMSRTARASIDQRYGSKNNIEYYIKEHLGTSNIDRALKRINEGGIVLSFTDYDDERHFLYEQRMQLIYDEIVKENQKHISRMLPVKEGLNKTQSVHFYSNLRFDDFIDTVKKYISMELDIDADLTFKKFVYAVSKKLGIKNEAKSSLWQSDVYTYPGPKIDFIESVESVMNRIHDIKHTTKTKSPKSPKSPKSSKSPSKQPSTKKGGYAKGARGTKKYKYK